MLEIAERGVRFRSYIDGSERFMGPEESMAVQAALGSDIALVFDECTPYHADRDYTARSTERTHRWLERCLAWHAENGPGRQAVFGIVQGGVHEDLRRESARGRRRRRRRRDLDRRHARPRQGGDARRARDDRADAARGGAEAPARDRRARRPARRDRARHRRLRLRCPDPARPPRDGARPAAREAVPLRRPPARRSRSPTSRSSRAARARPAPSTAAPTCTTSRGPRRRRRAGCSRSTT